MAKTLPLVQLEHDIFKCQHLLPQEIGANLHLPRVGDYWLVWNPFLLCSLTQSLMFVKAIPKLMLHIVYGMIHISHFLCKLEPECHVYHCLLSYFTKPMYQLALSTPFGTFGMELFNVPLGIMAFNLQYQCGMSHPMLYRCYRHPYVCSS